MQDLRVSFLIFCIVSYMLIGIGYSKRTFDVLSFGAVGDGKADDSQAMKFYGPCKSKSVHIEVLGNVVAPKTLDAWKECPPYSWIEISNVGNLRLDGSGKIDGQGSAWWSNSIAEQYSSFRNVNKNKCNSPKALHIHQCHNLQLKGLTHVNSPKAHISINQCKNVYISHLTISAPEDSPNTDGIDISNSAHVNIRDSYIGTGDDCIAINTGCSDLNISNIACGPGHGISVGSLGKNGAYDTVENVYVRDCSFNGTQNGVRIKTWQGGSGYARNITFENITLNAAQNPIIIDQFYCNGDHRSCGNQTSAVRVDDVRYIGVEGTSNDENAIKLECNQISGCHNIVMERINITSTDPGKKIYATCNNAKGTCSGTTVPAVPCLL